MKKCTKCHEEQELSEFYDRSDRVGQKVARCRSCVVNRTSGYAKENQEKVRDYHRKHHADYIAKYGRMNPEKVKGQNLRRYWPEKKGVEALAEYNRLFAEQSGCCKICNTHQSQISRGHALCVDHNAETGKVRGLLCHSCNRGIGLLKHNISNFQAAIEYLAEESL